VGALGWLTNTRTDAMIKISALQSQLGKAIIRDVQVANTLIKWLYKHDLTIRYPKVQAPFKLLSVNDAAFNTDEKGRSLRGSLILLVHDGPNNIGGPCHELGKACKTIKRVCRSTFASEMHAAIAGVDETQFVAMLWQEIVGPETGWHQLQQDFEKARLIIPVDVLTDANSLFTSLNNTEDKKTAEANQFVHLQALRQDFREGRIRRVIWVTTRDMVADGLTKASVKRDALRELLSKGTFILREPPQASISASKRKTSSTYRKSPFSGK
jgi:hypothetical protein